MKNSYYGEEERVVFSAKQRFSANISVIIWLLFFIVSVAILIVLGSKQDKAIVAKLLSINAITICVAAFFSLLSLLKYLCFDFKKIITVATDRIYVVGGLFRKEITIPIEDLIGFKIDVKSGYVCFLRTIGPSEFKSVSDAASLKKAVVDVLENVAGPGYVDSLEKNFENGKAFFDAAIFPTKDELFIYKANTELSSSWKFLLVVVLVSLCILYLKPESILAGIIVLIALPLFLLSVFRPIWCPTAAIVTNKRVFIFSLHSRSEILLRDISGVTLSEGNTIINAGGVLYKCKHSEDPARLNRVIHNEMAKLK